jgi:hypothetical protein
MLQRCYDCKDKKYPDYGGRGIAVCYRWRFGESGKPAVVCFIEDMGRRPSAVYSIDRIDNDGNYEPGNCRWATRKEQASNRRPQRNSIGIPGVQPCRTKYRVQIRNNGKTIHVGVYKTPEEASAAYMRAKNLTTL